MKKIVSALLLFLLTVNFTFSQENTNLNSNIRIKRAIGVSLYGLGAYGVLAGVATDAFISSKINTVIHFSPIGILGDVINFGGGINYHPWGQKSMLKCSPYLGFDISYSFNQQFLSGNEKRQISFYIPLGMNYISKKGFNISIDIGLAYFAESRFDSGNLNPYRYQTTPMTSLKFGYRFKSRAITKN